MGWFSNAVHAVTHPAETIQSVVHNPVAAVQVVSPPIISQAIEQVPSPEQVGTIVDNVTASVTPNWAPDLNLGSNAVNALQNPVSFSTGGLIGGSGGIATFDNVGGAGVQNSSLQGGMSNQNNSYGVAIMATYLGGEALFAGETGGAVAVGGGGAAAGGAAGGGAAAAAGGAAAGGGIAAALGDAAAAAVVAAASNQLSGGNGGGAGGAAVVQPAVQSAPVVQEQQKDAVPLVLLGTLALSLIF